MACLSDFIADTAYNSPNWGRAMNDHGTRYVTKDGDDSNDGFSWESPLPTVEAAIERLPTRGAGSDLHHGGTIRVGAGRFVEENP